MIAYKLNINNMAPVFPWNSTMKNLLDRQDSLLNMLHACGEEIEFLNTIHQEQDTANEIDNVQRLCFRIIKQISTIGRLILSLETKDIDNSDCEYGKKLLYSSSKKSSFIEKYESISPDINHIVGDLQTIYNENYGIISLMQAIETFVNE